MSFTVTHNGGLSTRTFATRVEAEHFAQSLHNVGLGAEITETTIPVGAVVEVVPFNCPTCGTWHSGELLKRTNGACPTTVPKLVKSRGGLYEHDVVLGGKVIGAVRRYSTEARLWCAYVPVVGLSMRAITHCARSRKAAVEAIVNSARRTS